MGRFVARGLALTFGVLAISAPAFAQAVEEGQGVADRARPDYDPIGHPVGSFLLYPSLTATGNATDNYRATDTDRQSDLYLTLAPELDIRSNWNRDSLNGRVYFSQGIHALLPKENASQYGASTNGQLDISRFTAITADASVNHFIESLSSLGSFQGAEDPVQYDVYHAAIGASQQFNRLTLHTSVGYNITRFQDARGFDGQTIDQTYRNYNELLVSGSAQYDVGAGWGLIVSGGTQKTDYSFGPGKAGYDFATTLDRNSTGYTAEGGVTFELSSLVFGSVQVGVLSVSYKDPRLKDVFGPTYNANILWNVTPLTSLNFHAARSIDETSSTIAAGDTRDDFSIRVDHELFRYIILSGNVSYGRFRPNGPGVGGVEKGVGGSARYLFSRHLTAGASAQFADRSADSAYLRYHAITGGLFVKYAY